MIRFVVKSSLWLLYGERTAEGQEEEQRPTPAEVQASNPGRQLKGGGGGGGEKRSDSWPILQAEST